MQRILVKLAVAGAAAFMVSASPAMAQATRTWISGVGDDVNPCSRTAPCKTFQGAISKTAPGGEINVLDPGGFGGVTITKSITLRSDTIEAGVLVSGTNGIIINAAATDRVVLDGLDIEGLNTGISGVLVLQARDVVVRNSIIRNFTTAGINVTGATQTRVTIDHVTFFNDAIGINVAPSGASSNSVKVSNSLIATSATAGIRLNGASSTGYISNNVIVGTAKSLDLPGGSVMMSYGNNVLNGTTTDAPTPTALQ